MNIQKIVRANVYFDRRKNSLKTQYQVKFKGESYLNTQFVCEDDLPVCLIQQYQSLCLKNKFKSKEKRQNDNFKESKHASSHSQDDREQNRQNYQNKINLEPFLESDSQIYGNLQQNQLNYERVDKNQIKILINTQIKKQNNHQIFGNKIIHINGQIHEYYSQSIKYLQSQIENKEKNLVAIQKIKNFNEVNCLEQEYDEQDQEKQNESTNYKQIICNNKLQTKDLKRNLIKTHRINIGKYAIFENHSRKNLLINENLKIKQNCNYQQLFRQIQEYKQLTKIKQQNKFKLVNYLEVVWQDNTISKFTPTQFKQREPQMFDQYKYIRSKFANMENKYFKRLQKNIKKQSTHQNNLHSIFNSNQVQQTKKVINKQKNQVLSQKNQISNQSVRKYIASQNQKNISLQKLFYNKQTKKQLVTEIVKDDLFNKTEMNKNIFSENLIQRCNNDLSNGQSNNLNKNRSQILIKKIQQIQKEREFQKIRMKFASKRQDLPLIRKYGLFSNLMNNKQKLSRKQIVDKSKQPDSLQQIRKKVKIDQPIEQNIKQTKRYIQAFDGQTNKNAKTLQQAKIQTNILSFLQKKSNDSKINNDSSFDCISSEKSLNQIAEQAEKVQKQEKDQNKKQINQKILKINDSATPVQNIHYFTSRFQISKSFEQQKKPYDRRQEQINKKKFQCQKTNSKNYPTQQQKKDQKSFQIQNKFRKFNFKNILLRKHSSWSFNHKAQVPSQKELNSKNNQIITNQTNLKNKIIEIIEIDDE